MCGRLLSLAGYIAALHARQLRYWIAMKSHIPALEAQTLGVADEA
jgi:hypothetical protein